MDVLNKLFDYIADKRQKLSHRAAVIIILATSAIIINDLLGFTYNYRIEHKIEQAQKISDVLKSPDLPLQTRKELLKMMDESLNQKPFLQRVSSNLHLNSLYDEEDTIHSLSENKNNILHLVSSAGITIVIFGFLLFYTVFGYHHDSLLERTAIGILVLAFGFVAVSLQYYITLAIPPKIFGSWIWNYAINFLTQICFYSLAYLFLKWTKSQSKEDSTTAPFGYRYRLAIIKFKNKK